MKIRLHNREKFQQIKFGGTKVSAEKPIEGLVNLKIQSLLMTRKLKFWQIKFGELALVHRIGQTLILPKYIVYSVFHQYIYTIFSVSSVINCKLAIM